MLADLLDHCRVGCPTVEHIKVLMSRMIKAGEEATVTQCVDVFERILKGQKTDCRLPPVERPPPESAVEESSSGQVDQHSILRLGRKTAADSRVEEKRQRPRRPSSASSRGATRSIASTR